MVIDPGVIMLISELGQRMGLSGLALNAGGTCALSFDGRSQVNIQYRPDADALWLYADLGVPVAGEAIYGELLRGNYFWRTTFGATLSLSGDDPARVVLAQPIAWHGIDGTRLAEILDLFLKTQEDWAELIAQPIETTTAPTSLDNDMSMIRI